MTLSWPKYLMLWLAIAAYSVQAVIGGSGWVICLGGSHSHTASVEHSEIEAKCDHHECGSAAQIAKQHAAQEECPCTDISIDDNEPGRIEDQSKLTIAKVKHEIACAAVRPWTMALSAPWSAYRISQAADAGRRGSGAEVVRTIVLLM